MDNDVVPLCCITLSMLLLAFASAAEVAAIFTAREKIKGALLASAAREQDFVKILRSPERITLTALVLKVVAIAVAAIYAMDIASAKPALWPWRWWIVVAVLLIGAVLDIMARALAARSPAGTSARLGFLIHIVSLFLTPVSWLFWQAERWIYGERSGSLVENLFLSEGGIRFLLGMEEGSESVIEEGEREMIDNIFEFKETIVREIMVPRLDIVALSDDTTIKDALDIILDAGHSRVPVYHRSIDQIVGVLYAKDLLQWFKQEKRNQNLKPLLRPPYFVPETKRVYDLLREMQKSHIHLAIVVDEYGGVAGVVTIEDLLEEIVGEIQDEYDQPEEEYIHQVNESTFVFDARVLLEDVNEVLGTRLESEGNDTLGGFVYSRFGHVPEPGESIQYDGLTLEVLSTSGRRIGKIRVQRPVEDSSDSDGSGDGKSGVEGFLSILAL